MTLDDILPAVRAEVETVREEFSRWYETILEPSGDESDRVQAAEAYSSQVGRLAETAAMINLVGLNRWCLRLNIALLSVVALERSRHGACIALFTEWPSLVLDHLDDPTDFDAAAALVAHLSDPLLPTPMGEEEGMELMTLFLAMPELPEEFATSTAAGGQGIDEVVVTEGDTSLVLAEDADIDVYNVFIDEAPNWATELGALIGKLANGSAQPEDVRSAKRIAHSFKGAANIVGVRGIGVLAHHLEDILEYLELHPVAPPAGLATVLLDAAGCLEQMVFALLGAEDAPEQAFVVLQTVVMWAAQARRGTIETDTVLTLSDTDSKVDIAESAPVVPGPRPTEQRATLRVPVTTVDDLFHLVSELTTRIDSLEMSIGDSSRRSRALSDQQRVVQDRVLELEKLVTVRGHAVARGVVSTRDPDGKLDPLELDRYNELHSITRTLIEAADDAREHVLGLGENLDSLRDEVLRHGRVNKELRRLVVSTRMTPVGMLVPRLTRAVRQTCQATGKRAELHVIGESVLVDGEILNGLADPLLHILRNAIDHGIELPQERIASGKGETGRVEVEFIRQGSRILLVVRDDGRGLNFVAIRAKALATGLLEPDQPATDEELARLTLLPGFSTRDRVTEISGRGVGMDVVVNRLRELKGEVEFRSEPGRGCEVHLRFYATHVTQHAMLVRAGGQTFALGSHAIERAIAAGLGSFKTTDQTREYAIGGTAYPVRILSELLGTGNDDTIDDSDRPVVLVRDGQQLVAVVVDDLIDSRERIIQGLNRGLAELPGLSGTTILANGSVAPLIDIVGLLRIGALPTVNAAAAAALAQLSATRTTKARVLVVDDSLSVRKSLTLLLRDASYDVLTAGDGIEAVKAIAGFKPQMVITDLEMPNMNGLELTEHLRRQPETGTLPVIMITSRSMARHRELARAAGVDAYLTKPYTDDELLSQIHDMLEPAAVP